LGGGKTNLGDCHGFYLNKEYKSGIWKKKKGNVREKQVQNQETRQKTKFMGRIQVLGTKKIIGRGLEKTVDCVGGWGCTRLVGCFEGVFFGRGGGGGVGYS